MAYLFRGPTSKRHAHAVKKLLLAVKVLFLWKILRISKTLAAWDDGNFKQGVSELKEPAYDCMSCLMICNCPLLLRL